MLLLVPWREYTLVGVWHVVFNGRPEEFSVTEEDLLGFIDEINAAYPGAHITLDEVTMWNAGLTLFGDNDPNSNDLSFGKRSVLIDHQQEHGVEGIISLIGVRYTTGRGMAEKAVDLALKKMGKSAAPSKTATTPVYGGDFDSFVNLVEQTKSRRPEGVNAEVISGLVHSYGTKAHQVLGYAKDNPKLGTRLGESKVIQAQVVHSIHQEMAERLSDVVFRRTDLGSGSHPGEQALRTCANLMAQELQWDETRRQQELDAVEKIFPKF
jgi:glycerol-3-phosphate dehydrogenase